MAGYEIEITRTAEKRLKTLPRQEQGRIVDAMLVLSRDPRPRGSRKLQGYKPLDEKHRIRKANDLAEEALQFLRTTTSSGESPVFATARRLARQLLPLLPVTATAILVDRQKWTSSR